MEMYEYQQEARKTAIYPGSSRDPGTSIDAISYSTLGLVGEAGEIANKVKKILRDEGGVITPKALAELEKELGDVLWYLSNLAYDIDTSLEYIADMNLKKLHDRKDRGVIGGSGDNR